jgi:hypothetical protein
VAVLTPQELRKRAHDDAFLAAMLRLEDLAKTYATPADLLQLESIGRAQDGSDPVKRARAADEGQILVRRFIARKSIAELKAKGREDEADALAVQQERLERLSKEVRAILDRHRFRGWRVSLSDDLRDIHLSTTVVSLRRYNRLRVVLLKQLRAAAKAEGAYRPRVSLNQTRPLGDQTVEVTVSTERVKGRL